MEITRAFARHGLQVVLAILVLAIAQSAPAQAGAGKALRQEVKSGARIAFQYVGINRVSDVTGPGAGHAFTIGYYTYIAGLPQPLFSNPDTVGEATAYFTFRSEPYSFSTFPDENILVRTVSPGFLIKLYYNQTPDQTFDNPDTFSDGQLIATFKVVTSLATRVENEANQQASLRLMSAQPFWFHGKRYTIRTIVHGGVTLISAGSALPVDDSYTAFAYAGSAFAD